MVRISEFIDRRQVGNFQKAISHASRIGRPLNLFVTINFVHTGCDLENASKCLETIRDRFTSWLAYQTRRSRRLNFGPPVYVWVIENGGGHTGAHWLVHVPEQRQNEFKKHLARWLEAYAGPVDSPQALDVRQVDKLDSLGLYMVKGINPRYANFYRIKYPKAQGKVYGKRCGISKILGPTARERHYMKKAAA